jgi:CIC family chloride channel protein
MVAVAVATLVVGDATIYESQVDTRADSPAHRHRFAFPLLSAVPAAQAAAPLRRFMAGTPVSEVMAGGTPVPSAVVDGEGRLLGELASERLERAAAAAPATDIATLAVPFPAVIGSTMTLDRALDLLASTERRWLPVVDEATRTPVGVLDAGTLIRAYREAARAGMRQAASLEGQAGMFEMMLLPASPSAGRRLRDAGLPSGARVVTLERDGVIIAPDGDTVLQGGDQLTIWCSPGARAHAFAVLFSAGPDGDRRPAREGTT